MTEKEVVENTWICPAVAEGVGLAVGTLGDDLFSIKANPIARRGRKATGQTKV